jgi:ribosomal protein L7Ae-like RNA K-turn-binding protein
LTDKALSMIGLATKAGKIASGEFAVESAVRKGKACLVIIASDNTKKSFNDMGAYYHVPVYIYGTKESLGTHTGRGYRASLAVLDAGFGKSIRKLIDTGINQ